MVVAIFVRRGLSLPLNYINEQFKGEAQGHKRDSLPIHLTSYNSDFVDLTTPFLLTAVHTAVKAHLLLHF